MNIRKLVSWFMDGVDDLNAEAKVSVIVRNKEKEIVFRKIVPVKFIAMNGEISIEQSDIDNANNSG